MRLFTHELVQEAKYPICNQIYVKVLSRQRALPAHIKKGAERQNIEKHLGLHGWPSSNSFCVPHGKPRGRALNALATTMRPTANPTQDNANGSYYREPIAGRAVVANKLLRDLHSGIAAKQ